MSAYSHLLYRCGFAITRSNRLVDAASSAAPIATWTRFRVGHYLVSAHPEAQSAYVEGPHAAVLMIGFAVDPFEKRSSPTAIVSALANADDDGFLDVVDDLTGRFAIIRANGASGVLLQDATGAQTVSYTWHDGEIVASSHATLISSLTGRPHSDEVARLFAEASHSSRSVSYLPGLLTPVEDVISLTPNTLLNLESGSVHRFWPREDRREQPDNNQIAARTAEVLTDTIELAAAAGPLHLSLSAGLDSRVTLAALGDATDDVSSFSYVDSSDPRPAHAIDLAVARELAAATGISHVTYEMGATACDTNEFDDFREVWLETLGLPRGLPHLTKRYIAEWPGGAMHLRSNVAEVGQVFYPNDRSERATPLLLSSKWNRAMGADERAIAAFDHYISLTSFSEDRLMGYEPLDLFYWEHRLSAWHGWLCLEGTLSHDTFVAFNNRRLLSLLLSAPRSDRLKMRAFYGVIRQLRPELLDLPINPKRWPIATAEESKDLPPRGTPTAQPMRSIERPRHEVTRLGRAAFEAQRWYTAASLFSLATDLAGDRWTWMWRARAEEMIGDLSAAERSARCALEMSPSFPHAALVLARVVISLGRPSEGREFLDTIDPHCQTDGNLLVAAAELYHSIGDHDGATRLIEHVLTLELSAPLRRRADRVSLRTRPPT